MKKIIVKLKKKLFLLHIIKMEQKALIFGRDCFNQNAFHKNGKPASIDKVDILISTSNRSVLSNKDSYVNKGLFKYFIRHIHNRIAFPVPLCIKLPQMNAHVKYFDSNRKYMNPLVHDEELLKKYNEILEKVK